MKRGLTCGSFFILATILLSTSSEMLLFFVHVDFRNPRFFLVHLFESGEARGWMAECDFLRLSGKQGATGFAELNSSDQFSERISSSSRLLYDCFSSLCRMKTNKSKIFIVETNYDRAGRSGMTEKRLKL